MKSLDFLDTNILLYSISKNPGEAEKNRIAIGLLDRKDIALSIQVLQEFYVQATRPTRPDALSHELAVGFISEWKRFQIQENTLAVLAEALEIKSAHGYSFWDCTIISAAGALGCRRLYTEDMQHGREVEGVLIVNPFS